MTDREKLIKLLGSTPDVVARPHAKEKIADHLLANGVTFATDTNDGCKWISVEDRLPKLEKYKLSKVVLAWIKGHGRCFALRYDNGKGEQWFSGGVEQQDITHWMPLPEPPEVER